MIKVFLRESHDYNSRVRSFLINAAVFSGHRISVPRIGGFPDDGCCLIWRGSVLRCVIITDAFILVPSGKLEIGQIREAVISRNPVGTRSPLGRIWDVSRVAWGAPQPCYWRSLWGIANETALILTGGAWKRKTRFTASRDKFIVCFSYNIRGEVIDSMHMVNNQICPSSTALTHGVL